MKNHPPDLINVALELLVKESLELPGCSTLDEPATRTRHEVNTARTSAQRRGGRRLLVGGFDDVTVVHVDLVEHGRVEELPRSVASR